MLLALVMLILSIVFICWGCYSPGGALGMVGGFSLLLSMVFFGLSSPALSITIAYSVGTLVMTVLLIKWILRRKVDRHESDR